MVLASRDELATYVPNVLLGLEGDGPRAWETDATLVFADVSGFTRLTERLSLQGKIGAEQIVAAISRVWTALLAACADDGGDVLKFGGDALLLLYEGDDHEHRAVHAALAMQHALRDVGRVETPRGPVRLRMSVGVHADRQQLLVCGTEHLELLVVGRGATTTVETESIAEAGQVLVSRDTAIRLGLPCGDGPRPVRRASSRITTPPARVVRTDPVRFLPVPLRDRLAGTDLHEHRRATIGFVHLGHVDDVLARRGLDGLLEPVQEATAGIQAALAEYGVLLTCTDIGADGVKYMLSAGVPEASEDDAGRMLRALRRIVDLPVEDGLVLRAGANAGHVFAGVVGSPTRRTWSTMGDATNLAARMMGKAPWGAVLATTWTVAESRSSFAVVDVPPMVVKGKTAPVPAALVGRAVDAAVRPVDAEVPLVGRDAELRVLRAALDDVRRGHGGAVELVGERGSGRSRLVDELQREAIGAGVAWLEAACQPYDRTTPYRLARVLLRRVLRIADDAGAVEAGRELRDVVAAAAPALEPWLSLLAVPVGATVAESDATREIDPRFRQQRIQQLVLDLLDRVAGGAAVVVVEDVGDADEASLDLLAHLVRDGTTTHPWLVVTSRRPTVAGLAPERTDSRIVTVDPLDDADAAALVGEVAERTPVPPHLQQVVVERGAGNPLFLLELARAAAAGAGELPPSVEAVVAARIDRLDPEDRTALRTLSVLGTSVPRTLRDRLLTTDGLDPARLDDVGRLHGLVDDDGTTTTFTSELVREVAYERLSYQRRRALHGLAADLLLASELDVDLGQVALHLARAERWAATWDAATSAADRARHDGANATAGELYELALAAARRLDVPSGRLVETATTAGDVWELAGAYDRAAAAYAGARRLAEGPARPHVTGRIALLHERCGDYSRARRWFGMALRELDAVEATADTRVLRTSLMTGDAGVQFRQGRLRGAVARCRTALGDAVACGDDRSLAHLYYLLTAVHADLGEEEEAARYRDLSLPVFERLGDLVKQGFVLNNMGVDAFFAGDIEGSMRHYAEARDRLARAGDVVGAAMSANNIAESLIELGRVDEAEPLLREAMQTWRGARYPIGVALATRNLGEVERRRGDDDAARLRLLAAREQFVAIGAQAFITETDAMLETLGVSAVSGVAG